MISTSVTPYQYFRGLSRTRELIDYEATRRAIDLSLNRAAFRTWQGVGVTRGAPGLVNGWTAGNHAGDRWPGESRFTRPWYFRDNWGYVHFRGSAGRPSGSVRSAINVTMFTLPPEVRPGYDTYLPTILGSDNFGDLATFVQGDGVLRIDAGTGAVSLKSAETQKVDDDSLLYVLFNNATYHAGNAGTPV